MLFWRRFGFNDAAAAILAVLFVVFGVGIWAVAYAPPNEAVGVAATPQVQQPAIESAALKAVPEVFPEAAEPNVLPEPDTSTAEVETADVTPLVTSAPTLDLIRVSPEGDAVVAGTTAPGGKIAFLVNGVELAGTTADRAGSFVGLFAIPRSEQPNSVTVAAVAADGTLVSDENILVAAIAPVTKAVPEVVLAPVPEASPVPEIETVLADVDSIVTPEDVPDVVAQEDVAPEVVTQEPEQVVAVANVDAPPVITEQIATIEPVQPDTLQNEIVSAPDVQTAEPEISTPAAPTIVIASNSGVQVVQPATQPSANVVIDTISYDDEGEVALVGRGSGGSFVRVYLDDKPILITPIEPDGSWETPLADVDAGVYRLRIDELSAAGDVTSRVETPFQREEVELAADAAPTAITVQPGSTLWAIAKDQLGDGVEFIRVFEANRDLIRDPNLIFPGQVFTLPQE